MQKVIIGFRGVEAVVEFDYSPATIIPLEGVNEPDEFNIRSVLIEGEEWINLLNDEGLYWIEKEIRTPKDYQS